MQVHTVTVSYSRTKQPKDYENANPEVSFSATLDEGEDHVAAAARLMGDACRTVYAGLGMTVPVAVARALGADDEAPAKPKRTAPKKSEKPAAKPADEDDVPGDDVPDDVPGDDTTDVPGDDDDAAGVPGDDVPDEQADAAPSDDAFTAGDLQSMFTAMMKSRTLTGKQITDVLRNHFKKARTSDLSQEQIDEFRAVLESDDVAAKVAEMIG